MSRFNTLMHGDLTDAAAEIDRAEDLSISDLGAGLSNTMKTVSALQALTLAQGRALTNLGATRSGKPGTGACICPISPEYRIADAAHHKWSSWQAHHANANRGMSAHLDHRCPKHGEAAQPVLWGRHKEMILVVNPDQWESLGVTHEEV